jgi:glycosyltransferase involved in cell wall biosynthesis
MISIIATTYNGFHFLTNALRSCPRGDEFETILVDDCSPMPFPDYAKKEIDRLGVRYFRTPTNMMLPGARNYGIERSIGDWFITLDEDDWFYPGAIQRLFSERKDADIVYGNIKNYGKTVEPCTEEITKETFLNGNPLFVHSLQSKKVWERIGGYSVKNVEYYEDWNYWKRAAEAGFSFKYVPVIVYNKTERQGSMCRRIGGNIDGAVSLTLEA